MILEIIMISIIGTILHWTYDWSNHNKIVGLFSAVNESTWEHIKMTLTATFICSCIDIIFLGSNPNYFFAKLLSLVTIIILMPLIFYTYTYITKKPIIIIDIISFYIVIFCSQILFYNILKSNQISPLLNYVGIIGTFIIFGLYMILTILPPKFFLFKDPITNKYGINGHK